MKVSSTTLSILFAASTAFAQVFQVNTPMNVVECQPTAFSWTGGQAPFFLSLTEGTTSGGATLKQFNNLQASPFTWLVDLQANTNFITNLKDSTGQVVQSAFATIGAGDRGCENTAVVESSGGAAGPTGGGSAPASSAPASSAPASSAPAGSAPASSAPAGSAPASSAPAGSAPAGSSPASPSGPSSAGSSGGASAPAPTSSKPASAGRLSVGTIGLTGLMGFVGAALF